MTDLLHGSQSSLNDDFADDDWDDLDDTFTADYSSDEDARSVSSNCSNPVACVALYNFDVRTCILSLPGIKIASTFNVISPWTCILWVFHRPLFPVGSQHQKDTHQELDSNS